MVQSVYQIFTGCLYNDIVDLEDLATGLLLSLGPMCGTLFRPKLDNHVTIFYSSRVN